MLGPNHIASAPNVDWVTAATGLIGVVLGAALSYFVTYQFERRRTRAQQLAKSFSLMFAVMKIADDLTKMEGEIRAAVAKADAAGVRGEVWTKLTISVGYSEPIAIPADDLAIVALTRDQELTTQVGEIESAHRIYTEAVRALAAQQEKFEAFGLHTAVDGQTVTFEANEAQLVRAGPTIIRLRTLAESLCTGVPRAAKQARAVAAKLGPHLKRHYKFKHFIELRFPETEAANGGLDGGSAPQATELS